MKVLVVDDDQSLVGLISAVLEGEGYLVQAASNGQEALDCVVETRPDLILLDLGMPVMDGWTCCRSLRQSSATSDIPVIIMSADGVESAVRVDLGVEHFLSKPFELDSMLMCIRRCMVEPSGPPMDGPIQDA